MKQSLRVIIEIIILAGLFADRAPSALSAQVFNDPTPTGYLGGRPFSDGFGSSIAIDGDWALISELLGPTHLFNLTTSDLEKTFTIPASYQPREFRTVAMDGNHVLIAAHSPPSFNGGAGQAFLFNLNSGALVHAFVGSRFSFGFSAAIDGNSILIGEPSQGLNATSGNRAYLYDAITGELRHVFVDPTPTSRDDFGESVAIDGNHVLIGAPRDSTLGVDTGQSHLFDANTGSLIRTFNKPNHSATFAGNFGASVALEDGIALIGEPSHPNQQGKLIGQAHVFDVSTGALRFTFDDPTPTPSPISNGGDRFGTKVALDGTLAIVAAPFDSTYGERSGQAYLFDVLIGSLLQTLDNPSPAEFDHFARNVDLDGNRALMGAADDDTLGSDVGQAYLFIVPEPRCMTLLALAVAIGFPARASVIRRSRSLRWRSLRF